MLLFRAQIDLNNVRVTINTKSTKEHIFELQLPNKNVSLKAKDQPSRLKWVSMIRKKSRNHGEDFSGRNSMKPFDNKSSRNSQHSTNVQIPSGLIIEGLLEVGGELRVRSADKPLENLHLAWFTYSRDAPIPPHADVSEITGAKYIEKATSEAYSIRDSDVGKRIGCTCRTVLGTERVCAATEERVPDTDPNIVTARIIMEPHTHNRYCDRRIRVCTAPGRYREHTVLKAVLRGPKEIKSRYRIRWYRSDVISYGVGNKRLKEDKPSEPGSDRSQIKMYRVRPRPVSHMPPAPSDSEPAPSIQDIRDKLKLEHSVTQEQLPVTSTRYPLFRDDIGRYIAFDIVPLEHRDEDDDFDGREWPLWGTQPKGSNKRDSTRSLMANDEIYSSSSSTDSTGRVCSLPVGPVEAGPPKAREIWLEGDQRVDGVLVGHWYYFGGVEGNTKVWWIKITPSGEALNVTEPVCIPKGYRSPRRYSKAVKALQEGYPNVLRLTEKEEGCLIKFKVHPVREDGDEGHTESSRPTVEIASKSSKPVLTKYTDPDFYDTHLQTGTRSPKPPPPCPAPVPRPPSALDTQGGNPIPKAPPTKPPSDEQETTADSNAQNHEEKSGVAISKPPIAPVPPSKRALPEKEETEALQQKEGNVASSQVEDSKSTDPITPVPPSKRVPNEKEEAKALQQTEGSVPRVVEDKQSSKRVPPEKEEAKASQQTEGSVPSSDGEVAEDKDHEATPVQPAISSGTGSQCTEHDSTLTMGTTSAAGQAVANAAVSTGEDSRTLGETELPRTVGNSEDGKQPDSMPTNLEQAVTSDVNDTNTQDLVRLWEEKADEDGDIYYYHIQTGDSMWERPDDFDTAVVRLPPGWSTTKDPEDRTQFLNHETDTVQWELPEDTEYDIGVNLGA